jgi:hypothetical protein
LGYYEDAAKLYIQTGDPEGERVARFNIAVLQRTLGDLAAAEEQLCRVVALDEATNNPDLDNDSEELAHVQKLLRKKRGN